MVDGRLDSMITLTIDKKAPKFMATTVQRGNSYRIKVSCGYDINGKQVVQSMTWTPKEGMTKKQVEKELNRQAVLFEEACIKGLVTSAVKFEAFSKQWDEEYAKPRYKKVTYDKTGHVLKRLNKEVGHMRLDKITTRTVQQVIGRFIKGTKITATSLCQPKRSRITYRVCPRCLIMPFK